MGGTFVKYAHLYVSPYVVYGALGLGVWYFRQSTLIYLIHHTRLWCPGSRCLVLSTSTIIYLFHHTLRWCPGSRCLVLSSSTLIYMFHHTSYMVPWASIAGPNRT